MLEINKFSELTDFVYEEIDKLKGTFGVVKMPQDITDFVANMIKQYCNIYNKPFLAKTKHEAKVLSAIVTMPHSWLWRVFHPQIWKEVKLELKLDEKDTALKQETNQAQNVYFPEVIKPQDVPQVYE